MEYWCGMYQFKRCVIKCKLLVYVIRWATEFLASMAIPPPLLLHANEFMVQSDGVRSAHLISSSEGLNHVSVRKRMSVAWSVTNSFILVRFSSVPTRWRDQCEKILYMLILMKDYWWYLFQLNFQGYNQFDHCNDFDVLI